MNQAHLHSDNMEDVRERLENTIEQSSVETMYDGEDCFITVTQKNYETMNESKWSFCVDFGTGKVQMLEPTEDEESFRNDNEIFRIIKNFLNGGSSREKRMNRLDYDRGEPIKITGKGNKIGNSKQSLMPRYNSEGKVWSDSGEEYVWERVKHKNGDTYHWDDVNELYWNDNGDESDYLMITTDEGLPKNCTPIKNSRKPIKSANYHNTFDRGPGYDKLSSILLDIAEWGENTKGKTSVVENGNDGIVFRGELFNEYLEQSDSAVSAFYKLLNDYEDYIDKDIEDYMEISGPRNGNVIQLSPSRKLTNMATHSKYNYNFFYNKLKDSPYFEEYVVRYDDDAGEDNIHTKNIPLVITRPDGKKQTYKDASLSFSGSGWRVSVGGWFGDSTYSDIINATIIDNRISITDSKNQEFDFFLDGNMIGSSRKPIKSAKSVCVGFNTENGTLLWKRDDLYTLDGSTIRQTRRQDIADRWIEKYDLNTTDERRLDRFTQEGPSQIPWGLPLVEDKDQTNYNKKLASILPPHGYNR